MTKIHRVFLPSPEEGDGILVDAYWSLDDGQPKVDNLKIHFILLEEVGKDVSNQIELSIYLWLARQAIEQIEKFIINESEY